MLWKGKGLPAGKKKNPSTKLGMRGRSRFFTDRYRKFFTSSEKRQEIF